MRLFKALLISLLCLSVRADWFDLSLQEGPSLVWMPYVGEGQGWIASVGEQWIWIYDYDYYPALAHFDVDQQQGYQWSTIGWYPTGEPLPEGESWVMLTTNDFAHYEVQTDPNIPPSWLGGGTTNVPKKVSIQGGKIKVYGGKIKVR